MRRGCFFVVVPCIADARRPTPLSGGSSGASRDSLITALQRRAGPNAMSAGLHHAAQLCKTASGGDVAVVAQMRVLCSRGLLSWHDRTRDAISAVRCAMAACMNGRADLAADRSHDFLHSQIQNSPRLTAAARV